MMVRKTTKTGLELNSGQTTRECGHMAASSIRSASMPTIVHSVATRDAHQQLAPFLVRGNRCPQPSVTPLSVCTLVS